jgi:hypothetical protein
MKNGIKIFSALILVITMLIVSCSKDKSPSETDFFVGTYHGAISFTDGKDTVGDTNGRVTVVKVGNSYTFDFGSGIPNITNVKFEKSGDSDNTYVSVGEGVIGITIDASSLKALVTNDKGTWTANCSR